MPLSTRQPSKSSAVIFAAVAVLASMPVYGANLTWDANGATAGQTDGAGTWTTANQWWDASVPANATWNSGTPDNATIGNGGAGGAISLGGNVTVGTLNLNNFTGTYTIQGTTNTLTNNGGITIGASAGNVTFRGTASGTPLTLTGAGGITMNGSGVLIMRENITTSYTGMTTINNGIVMVNAGSKSTGNFNLNGGILTDYFQQAGTFSGGLGTGANQIQVYGNSGFGGGNGTSNWTIGTNNSSLAWGSTNFNPSTLRFLSSADNMGPTNYGIVQLNNGLNLNGASRTISVLGATGDNAIRSSRAVITGVISGTGSSVLVKEGAGNLVLSGAGGTNTYAGGTSINAGMLRFDTRSSMPASGTVTVADGAILGVTVASSGTTWGGGTGVAGIAGLASTGNGGEGFGGQAGAAVNFEGNSRLLLNVTATTTETNAIGNGSATSIGLIKVGTGQLNLNAANTYTGTTTINEGTLATNNIANAGASSGIGAFATSGATGLLLTGGTFSYTGATASTDRGFTFGSSGSTATGTINVATAGATLGMGNSTINSTGALTVNGGAGSSLALGTVQQNVSWALTNTNAVSINQINVGATGINFSPTLQSTTLGSVSASNLAFTLGGAGGGTVTGSVNLGTGGLTKAGGGKWTLQGSSTVGTVSVNAGVLNIQHASALGTTGSGTTVGASGALEIQGGISVGAEALTLNGTGISGAGALRNISGNNSWGGLITLATGANRINSDAGTLTLDVASGNAITGTFALTLGGAGNTTVADNINIATAGLTKDGAGTVLLSAANTYTGATTISGGVLEASVLANGGTASSIGQSTNAGTNLVFLGGSAFGTLRYVGSTDVTTNRGFQLSNGTGGGARIESSGIGTLSFTAASGPASISFNTPNETRSLVLGGTNTGNNAFGKGIIDNGSGATSLTKSGAGKWIITGTNTYTGTTNIDDGTLLVNGNNSAATGAVNVNNTAVLGGTGTIGGAVTVASTATLSPGASIESLDVPSAILNGTLINEYDATSSGTSDLLAVSGLLTLGANSVLDLNPLGGPADDPAYIIATYGTLSGTFGSVVDLPAGYTVNYNYGGTNNTIAVVPIPEPTTLGLLAMGAIGLMRRRRVA